MHQSFRVSLDGEFFRSFSFGSDGISTYFIPLLGYCYDKNDKIDL